MDQHASAPDFLSFQVRDVSRSAEFYERHLGLRRLPTPNPDAAVFAGDEVTFAVRVPLPGTDLDALPQPGAGVSVWFPSEDAAAAHERMSAAGVPIVQAPFDGPFGTQFCFRDPDGYVVTVHMRR